MRRRLHNFLQFSAALVVLLLGVLSHSVSASAMGNMAGMQHEASSPTCVIAYKPPVNPLAPQPAPEVDDEDDNPSGTPAFLLRPAPYVAVKLVALDRYTQKLPAKVPLYIQYAQLRP